jgi:hypothetical protein
LPDFSGIAAFSSEPFKRFIARGTLVNQLSTVTFLPEPDIGDIILSTTSAGELLTWYGPSGCFPA